MKSSRILSILGLATISLLAACSDGTGLGNQSNGRMSIVNDPITLARQVSYRSEVIPIDGTGVGYSRATSGGIAAQSVPSSAANSQTSQAPITLTLVAEVPPPSIGGQTLQATSVAILGTRAVVSYNMRGPQYLGAIDVFDISNPSKPLLRSRALLQNTDVNAIATDGFNVFTAEATGDSGYAAPGAFEVVLLNGNTLSLSNNLRFPLSSYAGTSAAVSGTRVYATSGNTGALFAYDVPSYTLTTFSLHDARWVDVAEGRIVVVQGTPGQISVYNEANLSPVGIFPFTGANVAESKSTVQIAGGKAFIAAGSGGVQVLSASTGKVVGTVPRPDPVSLGLDSSVVVTNAAAVDNDLLFMANGEAGIYVAQGSQPFSATGSETLQQITVLGRLRFGSLQSVNHIAYKAPNLIIAAGLGGLKIVKVN